MVAASSGGVGGFTQQWRRWFRAVTDHAARHFVVVDSSRWLITLTGGSSKRLEEEKGEGEEKRRRRKRKKKKKKNKIKTGRRRGREEKKKRKTKHRK